MELGNVDKEEDKKQTKDDDKRQGEIGKGLAIGAEAQEQKGKKEEQDDKQARIHRQDHDRGEDKELEGNGQILLSGDQHREEGEGEGEECAGRLAGIGPSQVEGGIPDGPLVEGEVEEDLEGDQDRKDSDIAGEIEVGVLSVEDRVEEDVEQKEDEEEDKEKDSRPFGLLDADGVDEIGEDEDEEEQKEREEKLSLSQAQPPQDQEEDQGEEDASSRGKEIGRNAVDSDRFPVGDGQKEDQGDIGSPVKGEQRKETAAQEKACRHPEIGGGKEPDEEGQEGQGEQEEEGGDVFPQPCQKDVKSHRFSIAEERTQSAWKSRFASNKDRKERVWMI